MNFEEGPMLDLLWSDPGDLPNDEPWRVSPRGSGWLFGHIVTQKFTWINNLDLIVRSLQLQMDGFSYCHGNNGNSLLTIWSCPNHNYRVNNPAAVLSVDENMDRSVLTFHDDTSDSRPVQARQHIYPYFSTE